MKEIQFSDWKDFKEVCIEIKELNIQYTRSKVHKEYHIFAVEDPIYWYINLIDPKDIVDFEKNYLKTANKRIDGEKHVRPKDPPTR